jgi:hypothetical protein
MIQKNSAAYLKTKLEFMYKILSTDFSSAVSLHNELYRTLFNVLLTVDLGISLVINQLNAQNLVL